MKRLSLIGFAVLAACTTPDTQIAVPDAGTPPPDATAPAPRVLLYTKEVEWFHPSNPIANAVLLERGKARGWQVESTNDNGVFTAEKLANIDIVVFVMTSGNTLAPPQRDAFAHFIATGHGWAGVHSASHTEHDWTFMKEVVGAAFDGHPLIMPANITIEAPGDPIVSHFPRPWAVTDEYYSFDRRPENNPRINVLQALDEQSARPDYPGPDFPAKLAVGYHPITWKQQYGASRTFYTGLGHPIEMWSDDLFVSMVVKGIEWAALASTSARLSPR